MAINNEKLKLAKFLAVKFAEDNIDWKQWPEDVEAEQTNYEVNLEGWKSGETYESVTRGTVYYDIGWEVDGEFPYLEEYEDGETLTQEEFFTFMKDNPNYVRDIKSKRQAAVAEIARLNQVAYDAVEAAMKLSAEVDLPYSCKMPSGVADLDENSDWNSSRC